MKTQHLGEVHILETLWLWNMSSFSLLRVSWSPLLHLKPQAHWLVVHLQVWAPLLSLLIPCYAPLLYNFWNFSESWVAVLCFPTGSHDLVHIEPHVNNSRLLERSEKLQSSVYQLCSLNCGSTYLTRVWWLVQTQLFSQWVFVLQDHAVPSF